MVAVELDEAQDDFARGDWLAAYDAWSARGLAALPRQSLENFATAAELLGHHDEAVDSLQRAFLAHQEAGELRAALRCAFRLSMSTATHGEVALSAGWTARAESLLEDIDEDCAEGGWVAFMRMFRHLGVGMFADAEACADEATAAGRRHRDTDLVAIGLCSQGRLRIYTGRVDEGLACLDESMVRVISGEVSPIIAGHVYCTAIEGCQEISDFARVAEWTSALERWCSAQPGLLMFTGQCALHRGQLLRRNGQWAAALEELEQASRRYLEVGTPDAIGLTQCEAGDVLRLRGEYDAADAAYQRAADRGFDPQPGLALLWLALGQVDAAVAAVKRLLDEPSGPVQRWRVLPAAVEVMVAAGDLERARSLSAELDAMSLSRSQEAAAAESSGLVELASADAAGALPYLRKAAQLWAGAGSPYDQARVRALTGRALTALGDGVGARRELEAAREAFRRLGAEPDADAVTTLLAPDALPGGLTAREVEVLRLVATGRSNPQVAADLVLSEKTVARHLSNIFTKLDVGSRTAATAYAFEHGLV